MALSSTQYTNFTAAPPLKVRSQDWHGRVRVAYGDFTAAAMLGGSANGCVQMVQVPSGARILDGQLFWSALGASTQLFVGDQFVCDRFMLRADGSVASALQQVGTNTWSGTCGRFSAVTSAAQTDGIGYLTTCDTTVIVSNLSGSATGVIKLVLYYSVE